MITDRDTQATDRFDARFAANADPWGTRRNWYEKRKRALLLAALPRSRYAAAYEPACGNGELTAALAARCERVLASDASGAALQHASGRPADFTNVRLIRAQTPDQWPEGHFDLIVLSEFGYYVDDAALETLAGRCRDALGPDGTLVACHWRHAADDFERNADAVHQVITRVNGLPRLALHLEEDFIMEIWTADERSVAQREGLA